MAGKKAKVLSSKLVYQGKVFGVRHLELIEPGGIRTTRDIVTHHGSVVILPVLPDGRILMVRQYRHTFGGFMLELVAGRIEPGEKPLVAAKRELAEETGYRARRVRKMLAFLATPGFVQEPMTVYLATGLTPGKTHFDEDERVEAKPFKLKALLEMIRKGQLHDAKSIAGLLYYSQYIFRG